jgi:hypothetical protein
LPGPGPLEPELWSKLQFHVRRPVPGLRPPFEIAVDPDQLCGACLAPPAYFDRARAALIYGDVSRDLVLGLKYQGRRDGLSVLAGWMASAGSELLADADLITPVPLHYFRLVRRGFNQSAWLAAALSRTSGVKLSVDVFKRVKLDARSRAGSRPTGAGGTCRERSSVRARREALVKDRKSCWSMMF